MSRHLIGYGARCVLIEGQPLNRLESVHTETLEWTEGVPISGFGLVAF